MKEDEADEHHPVTCFARLSHHPLQHFASLTQLSKTAYGLRHWMEHYLVNTSSFSSSPSWSSSNTSSSSQPQSNAQFQLHDDDIVLLMDPDMILLRPLTHDFSPVEQYLWATSNNHPPTTTFVQHGRPFAQQDGYLSNSWQTLPNLTYIVHGHDHNNNNNNSHPFALPSGHDGPLYWNAGPPYLATVRTYLQTALQTAMVENATVPRIVLCG